MCLRFLALGNHVEKQSSHHKACTNPLVLREGVSFDSGCVDNGEEFPSCAHGSASKGAHFDDGVEDENLTKHRAHCEQSERLPQIRVLHNVGHAVSKTVAQVASNCSLDSRSRQRKA